MNFKIATWNVNSINARLPQVLKWLAHHQPDVLALQEIKCTNEFFPLDEIRASGYHAVMNGQKAYNGVALISKQISTDVILDVPQLDDVQRRILVATINDTRIINLYVPNGEAVGSEKYQYKLNWLATLTQFIEQQLTLYPRVIVLGDFNIAPEARDVHDPELWEGKNLFSEPERQAFQTLLQTGFVDTFRLFEQAERSFTWWDYRMLGFRRNHGLRIDLILANQVLASQCEVCVIDKEPRGWDRPSDHAPVMATFKL